MAITQEVALSTGPAQIQMPSFRAQQSEVPPPLGFLASSLALCSSQLPYNLVLGNQVLEGGFEGNFTEPRARRSSPGPVCLCSPYSLVLSDFPKAAGPTSATELDRRSLRPVQHVLSQQQKQASQEAGGPLPTQPLSTQPLGYIPWPHQSENTQLRILPVSVSHAETSALKEVSNCGWCDL